MTYTIQPSQTLMDAALMATGTLENLFAIAATNELAVSDDVAVGLVLIIPDSVTADTNTLAYLAANEVVIGTVGNGVGGIFTDEFDTTFD